ncbi:MAG TPA: hypothetical protein VFD01_12510 [Candidatus Dormibacteraeota bacterium]|nr:hypothetical protein [Candidatus Dormibacteraeota bacterium]
MTKANQLLKEWQRHHDQLGQARAAHDVALFAYRADPTPKRHDQAIGAARAQVRAFLRLEATELAMRCVGVEPPIPPEAWGLGSKGDGHIRPEQGDDRG